MYFEIDKPTGLFSKTPARAESIQKPQREHVVGRISSGLVRDLALDIHNSKKNPVEVCSPCRSTDSTQCGHSPTRDDPVLTKQSSAPSASYWALLFSRYLLRRSVERRSGNDNERVTTAGIPHINSKSVTGRRPRVMATLPRPVGATWLEAPSS
jgi:hypothetical protein